MPVGWLVAAAGARLIALVIGLPALRLRGLHLALVTVTFGLTLQASLLRWQFFTRGSAGVALPQRLWGDTTARPTPRAYLSVSLLLLLGVWLARPQRARAPSSGGRSRCCGRTRTRRSRSAST